MTFRELIYDVREKLKLNSDDIDISDEYIAHLINVERVFFIKQRFSKFTRNLPEEIKQVICIDLEEIKDIEDICDSDTLLKSVQKIPTSIEIGGRNALISIRNKQITGRFLNIIPIERIPYVGYNKWLKGQTYIALDADNHLYIKKTDDISFLETIKITGVFSNPEEADKLNCESTENCDFFDKQYPIEPYIISEVIHTVVQKLLPTLNIPDDKMNNSDESNRN